MKKMLSIAMAFLMLLAMVPTGAIAVSAATSGTTGDCIWTLEGTHLTISGDGVMGDYSINNASPWGTSVTVVTIEEGVTSIGEWSFKDCFDLESVHIADSVVAINTRAFSFCTSLKCVEVPKNVVEIGSLAFYGCFVLERIVVDSDNPCYYGDEFGVLFDKSITTLIKCPERTANYVIPESVLNIEQSAFDGCNILQSVVVPVSMLQVGAGAFNSCGNLKYVFYLGDATQKRSIAINSYNTNLQTARWHYNMSDHDYVLKVDPQK